MSDERERSAEERVTAYVDGALGEAERAVVEALLRERPDLREQAEFERGLRERLRACPFPSRGPASRRRCAARCAPSGARRGPSPAPPRRRPARRPVGARPPRLRGPRGGSRPREMLREGQRFPPRSGATTPRRSRPGSRSRAPDAAAARGRGPPPARGRPLLSAGRPLRPHLYYAGRRHQLSLFVVPGPLRFERHAHPAEALGQNVRFLRSAGVNLAVVAEEAEAVDAFAREFARPSLASKRARSVPESPGPEPPELDHTGRPDSLSVRSVGLWRSWERA